MHHKDATGSVEVFNPGVVAMVYPNPQVYHHLKAIFVHVPKTAGTSIEQSLLPASSGTVGGHTTALGFRSKFPREFAEYFTFGMVRHPAPRFTSAYRYLAQEPIHPALGNRIVHECKTLGRFLDRIRGEPEIVERIVHLWPQHRFLCDETGEILVDRVFRFEKLDEAWVEIAAKLKVVLPILPRLNKTGKAPSADMGTSQVNRFVQHHYAQDFAVFGFNRGSLP